MFIGRPVCAHRCVCVRACDFLWLRPVCPHVYPCFARAVRGRYISSTKVRALPESLGRCKLLEKLCVPPPPPCAFAAVPALRCCACAAAPGAGPHLAAFDAAAAALPVAGRRPSASRAGTRPEPSSRRCRRWSTGPTSRHCECPRRRAHKAPPMRRRVAGGERRAH